MTVDIRVGGALTLLRAMPDASVHCVITSPPYWGLRAYGGDPGMIGREPTFAEHIENLLAVFREVRRVLRPDGSLWLNYGDAYARGDKRGSSGTGDKQASNRGSAEARGARLPSGMKSKNLMGMPWRVAFALQDDGWWLRSDICWQKSNPMPESAKDRPTRAHEFVFLMTTAERYFYDHEAVKESVAGTAHPRASTRAGRSRCEHRPDRLPHDSIEARKARANPAASHTSTAERRGIRPHKMPEGQEKVRVPTSWASSPGYEEQDPRYGKRTPKDIEGRSARMGRAPGWREGTVPGVTPKSAAPGSGIRQNESYQAAMIEVRPNRNLRDVWTFASAPFRGAHFATFPPALVEPCIKAGTSEHGVCPECGAPWERVINKMSTGRVRDRARGGLGAAHSRETHALPAMTGVFQEGVIWKTAGWRPSCACYDDRYRAEHPEPRRARKRRQRAAWGGRWQRVRARPGNREWPTSPAIVLDPFAGAGTAGLVAERLGRDSILIEINPTYAAMSRSRINVDASLLSAAQ